MFDQILEQYRKAAESTMQFQQEMLRQLTQHYPAKPAEPGATKPVSAASAQATKTNWTERITDMLNKHRETLDAQYRAGIRTIEDAFRVAEAKDPEQFRKLSEELWRHSFDYLKNAVETQIREVQAALKEGVEAATTGAASVKK